MNIPEEVKELHKIFTQEGFEIRLVGGCVRDMLLNKIPKDWDMATTATPSEMIDIAVKHNLNVIPTGIVHGTLTFVINKEHLEVTVLRQDMNCDGRHATVEFTNNFKVDAERRDFTINAMSIDIATGEVFDFFGGKEDAANQVIKFVGNTSDRISEDFLRVLRFFRFAQKFDNPILDNTALDIIKQDWVKTGLKEKVSLERSWSEFSKMLSSDKAFFQFGIMSEVGILDLFDITFNEEMFKKACSKNVSFITRLATMVMNKNPETIARSFKASLPEIQELVFIVNNMNNPDLKRLIAFNNQPRKWVEDIAMMNDIDISDFNPPIFPVQGRDLMSIMKPGPNMGITLNKLKTIWVDNIVNGNELTIDDLLKRI